MLAVYLMEGRHQVALVVKNRLPMQQTNPGLILGSGGSLEEEMATHFNILAWEIPCTEEPDRL